MYLRDSNPTQAAIECNYELSEAAPLLSQEIQIILLWHILDDRIVEQNMLLVIKVLPFEYEWCVTSDEHFVSIMFSKTRKILQNLQTIYSIRTSICQPVRNRKLWPSLMSSLSYRMPFNSSSSLMFWQEAFQCEYDTGILATDIVNLVLD